MINDEGTWNLELFRIWQSKEIIRRIVSISPPHISTSHDRINWARTSTSFFSLKSGYWSLRGRTWNPRDTKWNISWKFQGHQRVRFFLWLVLKQRLLTNVKRVKRGIRHDSSCGLYGHHLEDILHAIRDCTITKETWMQVLPNELHDQFFASNIHDLIKWNLFITSKLDMGEVAWSSLFGSIAWRIWKNCNLYIFQGVPWKASDIVKRR